MVSSKVTAVLERLRDIGRLQRIPVPLECADGPDGSNSGEALEVIGPVPMAMVVGQREVVGRWYVAAPASVHPGAERSEHVSLWAFGDPARHPSAPLVRIHSTCFTGDVLGSLRCDCGPQLESALQQIVESPAGGVLVYMAAHEGRGIGLWSKAAAYLLQDEGLDTYEANRALGYPDDQRDFRHAAALIHHLLGERPFQLLTNNPDKVSQMRALGLEHVSQRVHVTGVGARNQRYLCAKREHGHRIPALALGLGR
ncbi:MAG: GTP cyclohydrolase II [Myxococcales bacterium]|nr:GTP cyclohydrolase II [Myxococcales bacterium]